jgi:GT2 family glycosyltransferase
LLILLHDDAEIEPGWMEALVETADTHPEAGAIGGKVLYPDGRLQHAGLILWQNAETTVPWAGEDPAPDAFDRLRAVDFCGTSSLLVRAALWDIIGGLDEQFYPVYSVDSDLAMAVRKLGFVVLYQPASRIRHHQAASTNPGGFRNFLHRRNRLLLLKKWSAALENLEPYENSPAAVERALARAETFADQCRHTSNMPIKHVRSTTFNAAEQDSRCVKERRALQKAYIAYLMRRMLAKLARLFRQVVGKLRPVT